MEAKLIAMRLGTPPAGYGRWSLSLLADQLVELEVVDAISVETDTQDASTTSCYLPCLPPAVLEPGSHSAWSDTSNNCSTISL